MKLLALVFVFLVANSYVTVAAPVVTYDQRQDGDLNVSVDLKDIQIIALLDSGLLGDYGDIDYAYDYADFTVKPVTPQSTPSGPTPSTLATSSVEPWHTWPTIAAGSSTSTTTAVSPIADVTVKSLSPESSEPEIGEPEKAGGDSSSAVDSPAIAAFGLDAKIPAALPEPQTSTIKESSISLKDDKTGEDDPVDEKKEIAGIPASSASSDEKTTSASTPESSEALIDQTQQPLKKCSPGHSRDQKGRCSRPYIRRRVPSLLPFGIRLSPRIYRPMDQQSETSKN